MIAELRSTLDDAKCNRAVVVISDLIRTEYQGFILPPSEVKRLLGIPGHYQTWYLHRSITELRKKLANNFISIAVSPEYGICFTIYQIPGQMDRQPSKNN